MSALVRLHVDPPHGGRVVRLAKMPTRGELIPLADGTHVTVSEIETNATGIVVADIHAEPVSEKPQAHGRPLLRRYLARSRHALERG